ncbi:MAG: pilus assembly protein [Chloroflexi bacterium]|nr:pilus assembly protein [Chloroflexota bacterium]
MIERILRRDGRRGQASLEVALALPALVLCLAGLVAVHCVVDARLQAETLAREAARVMGEAPSYPAALAAGERRFREVAAGLALEPDRLDLTLEADPAFARGSVARATVSYRAPLARLPFGLGEPTLIAVAAQPVQRYGSRRP